MLIGSTERKPRRGRSVLLRRGASIRAEKRGSPYCNTARGHRHYTALFSNTARARQTGNTRDWVVLCYDDGNGEQQATVMTCTRGPLKGKRVVRGREGESRRVAPGEPQVSFPSEA